MLSWGCTLTGVRCVVMDIWTVGTICCHGHVVCQDSVLPWGCGLSKGWCVVMGTLLCVVMDMWSVRTVRCHGDVAPEKGGV